MDSLVNQTLKDIEIICINDCSPDNSLVILKEYAKKDGRIKVTNFKKNKGYAIAINAGLAKAKGEYVGFVDSDDYVDLDFYEKLYKLAKNKNADIAKGSCKKTDSKTGVEKIENVNKNIRKHKCYFYTHFWTAIYRRATLIRHLMKFPPNCPVAADLYFLNHAVIVAKDVCFLNHSYYHYLRRENSLDSDFYSKEKIYSSIYCFNLILNRLNSSKVSELHYSIVYKRFFYSTISLLLKNPDLELHKKIIQSIIHFYHKCIFPKKLDLPKPIIAVLENRNKTKLVWLLQNWVKWDFYPFIELKRDLLQNRKLYVWGTGEDGIRVKKQCESYGWKITSFLDSNKSIKKYHEYKVVSPEQILNRPKKDYFIIISSRKYKKEIAGICKKAGLNRGKDFWRPD